MHATLDDIVTVYWTAEAIYREHDRRLAGSCGSRLTSILVARSRTAPL